jgi:hypothetical protein
MYCTPNALQARVSGYSVRTTNGSAIDMSGASDLWRGWSNGHDYGWGYAQSRWYWGDYQQSGTIMLPFNFTFNGVQYDAMNVYESGCVSLGYNGLGNSPYNDLSNPGMPVIAPWWDDIWLTGCQGRQSDWYNGCGYDPARVSYQFLGSAPDRFVVIDWHKVELMQQWEVWGSFQLRFYENGKIEFYYGNMGEQICNNHYDLPSSASIGLADGNDDFLSITPTNSGNFRFSSTSSDNNVALQNTPIQSGKLITLIQLPNVQLTVDPHVYNFGSQWTGRSLVYDIVVKHAGTEGKLSVNSISLTGSPDFSIISAPASYDSIDVGDTRVITVKFAPLTDGLKTAIMTVTSNGVDSGTQRVDLTGIGLSPLISVDTNIIFKNTFTPLGQTRKAKIKIFSTNPPTLILNAFQFSGADAGEYFISQLPSSMSLPGGTVDSFEVTYRPTKEGRHTATLTILNNSVNNPALQISLWGTGVLPHITVNPNPLLFDSVSIGVDTCKTITIRNPGTDTLRILSNTLVSNDGDFIYAGLTGNDTLIPPDKFKTVTVCFRPKAKGTRVARLRLTTNITKTFEQPPRDTAGQFLIDIRGNGVPTGVLAQTIGGFEDGGWTDSTLIGTQICIVDSLVNNGDADVLINAISFTGAGASTYTASGYSLPFILKAKASVAINICATPMSRGYQTANLVVTGSASEKAVQSIAVLNVKGLLACANALPTALFEQTLIVKGKDSTLCTTVTNCGDIAATYTAVVSGTNASDYSVTPGSSATVNPGQSATFCVKYNPTAAGKSPAILTISAPNTPNQVVTLNAEAGCAIVNAQLPNLETMGKGGKYQITLTITNTGNFDWTPTGIEGLDSTVLHYISGLGPIPPGGNIQIVLEITPDDINHHYNFPLTITGVPCEQSAATATVDFTTNSTNVPNFVNEAGFILGQNHPNPFTASTEFSYTTPTEANIVLSIHDITGKLVKVISSGTVISGEHTVKFNADELSSGTYLLTLESGSVKLTRQIMITK